MKNRMTWDIVTCIGPADESILSAFLPSLHLYLAPRRIYVITSLRIIKENQSKHDSSTVQWVNETSFPFSIQVIHDWFHVPQRSGWYFQQLLKLYAPLVLHDLAEQFLYVDADVRLHRPLQFFQNGKLLFNVGTEFHAPYFCHMERLLGLAKIHPMSGICHLMPMKKEIVRRFHEDVERRHGIPCWMAFLAMVDPKEYPHSGASEYELLFTYTLMYCPNEVEVRPLRWRDTSSILPDRGYDYEAWHWHLRESHRK